MSAQNKKINIMQWNSRSAVSNKYSLQNFLSNNKVDIALISETWFKPNVVVNFNGYNLVRKDRFDGKAGVAILIKKSLNFRELQIINNFSDDVLVCGAEVKFNSNLTLSLLSIYRPPNINTTLNEWKNVFSQVQAPLIIGGDLNAHNYLWGSSKNDHVGIQIVNAADDLELININNGSATRLEKPGCQKSVVDITLASSDIVHKITWNVIPDTLGSDHYPILMNLDCQLLSSEIIYPRTKWNIKNANWPLYTEIVDSFFNPTPSFTNTNEKANYILDSINKAATLAIPEFKPFQTKCRPPPPWWDTECDSAISQRKQSILDYKQVPSEENYFLCKQISARTKKILKNKAKTNWIKWCSDLNKNTNSHQLWNQSRRMHRVSQKNKKSNCEDWLQEFYVNITPPSVEYKQDKTQEHIEHNHFLSKPFLLSELDNTLKNVANTSPGMDEIKYSMIFYLPNSAKYFLLNIYNDIWITGSSVDILKQVLVIPIYKPGKDPNVADSYRPISLLSCLLKTFERMIKNRLEWWIHNNNLSEMTQFGYRKGYGTIDAVSTLVVDIQTCFSRNNYLSALFLDIKGAYDSVNLHLLEEKLHTQFLIPRHAAKSIISLFTNRQVYVRKLDNKKIGYRINNIGLPQGSVLSPLLFNLFTADISTVINNGVRIVQYADDFCIYSESKNYDKSIEVLDHCLTGLKKWFINNGFDISQEKSIFCSFSRHNTPKVTHIYLGEFKFPCQTSVKYLGIFLDKKLTWKPFIESIIDKCNKGINFLKLTTKTWWGADIKTALLFYKSYIRSIIDYGCVLYGSASKTLLNRLDVVQNKALRICLGAMKSTPTEPLHLEALEPPLHLRRQFLSNKFLLKQKANKTPLLNRIVRLNEFDLTNKFWTKKSSPPLCSSFRECVEHFSELDNLFQIFPSYDFYDFITPVNICIPQYHENTIISTNILNSTLANWPNSDKVYTDSSKSTTGVGSAYFSPVTSVEAKYKLNKNMSIFTGEAIAIHEALKYIKTTKFSTSVILTDSLSVLRSLENTTILNTKTNPYIFLIKNLLHTLQNMGKEVILLWVKAHIGLKNNEYVDCLAKKSATSGIISDSTLCLSDVYNVLKVKMVKSWSYDWNILCHTNPSRYTFIHPDIPDKFWHDSFNVPRKYITSIVRLKFGHGCYPAHLHKLGIINSGLCDTCDTTADLDHIFFNCKKYKQASDFLQKNINKLYGIPAPLSLSSLLHLNSKKIYDCLIEFLKSTKLKV